MKIQHPIFYLAIILGLLSSGGTSAENFSGSSFVLSVNGNSLSLKGEEPPLGHVLKELGRQADIKVYIPHSVANEKVPFSFEDFPLEKGLKLILRGRNYVLTYKKPFLSKGQSLSPKVTEIRVLPGGGEEKQVQARKLPPPPAQQEAPQEEEDQEGEEHVEE